MDKLTFRNTYWNYYKQLESDFFSYSPYCEIDECNENAFSVRYLQLYLSICGEIDTICKRFCKLLDDNLELDRCGINSYISILNQEYPTIAQEKVELLNYKYNEIQPWQSIKDGNVPGWWTTYNAIKHHRDEIKNGKENYKCANQKNVINALCALYVLIEYWAAKNFAIDKDETQNSVMILFVSKKLRLTHWNFYEAFMGKWFNTKRFYEYLEKKVV